MIKNTNDQVLIFVGGFFTWTRSTSCKPEGNNQQPTIKWGDMSTAVSIGTDGSNMGETGHEGKHRLVQNQGSKIKLCVYCQRMKCRTKSGWYIYSQNRCQRCDVSLCKRNKACFVNYHRELGIPDSEFMDAI